jgi:hypothetical protein
MRKKQTEQQSFEAEGLSAQREYIQTRFVDGGDSFDLLVAESFVRGMRELGYKSNAHALDELIDNSEQSGATNVHIAFGYDGKSDAKPTAIAVIDDGHGMDAPMIRAAMMWGGTHRADDRRGFGRFGYGLPSATVSISARYAVYSWTAGGTVHGVTFDLEALKNGKYRGKDGRTLIPTAKEASLPNWVSEHITTHFPGGIPKSGTVVILDSLDRLRWKTTKVLREKLSEHFGVTYRNYLRVMNIVVDGAAVEPIDPLFLTPGAKFFSNDAEGLPAAAFEVKDPDTGKPLGVVKVRFSYLPPAAFSSKYADPAKLELNKARSSIREQHNGLLILRNGRQLDLITKLPRGAGWKRGFKNYDAFYKVEIDFPATLDEEFSVTTAKQQVVLSDRMWELLRQIGLPRVMADLYKRVNHDLVALKKAVEDSEQKVRASEQVMQDIQKYKARRSEATAEARKEEAERNRSEHIRRRAKEARVPEDVVEKQFEAESHGKIYLVEAENLPGAPFFRVVPRGTQIVLLINEGHRFYEDLYASFASSPQLRSGLELLLFVIGEAELDANPDRRRFYEGERAEWSRVLNTALDRLIEIDAAEFETDAEELLDEEVEEPVAQTA